MAKAFVKGKAPQDIAVPALSPKLPDYVQNVKTNKTVEQLLAEIKAAGWLVNNLFQYADGMWRANLRFEHEVRGEIRSYFHEFADAKTPEEALAAAIWNMQQKRNHGTRGGKVNENAATLSLKRNEVARQNLQAALELALLKDALK